MELSSPVGAAMADRVGTGTILDDDGFFHVTVADSAAVEGNARTHPLTFAVTLSAHPATGQTVSVNVATHDGTATVAGNDYTALSQTLTWNPSDPLTKFVVVSVRGDALVEPNETFFLNLSSSSAVVVLSDLQAKATIVNDD